MSEKKKSVPHRVLSDRGVNLEQAHLRQQDSRVGSRTAVIIQDTIGNDISVALGQKCPVCKMRVRGKNHASGAHHRGTVKKCSR